MTSVSLSLPVTSSYIYMAAKETVHEYDQGAGPRIVLSALLRECVRECVPRLIINAAGCIYSAVLHDHPAAPCGRLRRQRSFVFIKLSSCVIFFFPPVVFFFFSEVASHQALLIKVSPMWDYELE